MVQAYRVLKDSNLNGEAKVGTIVYAGRGYDYGLASDDTRATGIEHVSVTLKRSGDYPTFTVPLRDLEEIETPPLPKLDGAHVDAVCRPGAGALTCRYLAMGATGWSCEKHSSLAHALDERARLGTVVARGDNCEGRS